MTTSKIFLTILAITLLSFISDDKNNFEFNYPKNKDAAFTMATDKLKKFKKEWRGEDYYYISENGNDNFICSVLFYKLNKNEVKDLHEIEKQSGAPKGSPVYPMIHFSGSSNTKQYETNEHTWGDPNGEFMFRQVDIKEFNGQKLNQKNMFGYTMFGEDLYVNVHLSKVLYTPEDSIAMVKILDGLKKKK